MKTILILLMLIPAFFLDAAFNFTHMNEESILVHYTIDPFELNSEGNLTFIEMGNWSFLSETGAPLLPVEQLNISVPPEGEIQVNILNEKHEKRNLSYSLAPVPHIIRAEKTSEYLYQKDDEKFLDYSSNNIRIYAKEQYRRFEFFPVRFLPILYDSTSKELTVCVEMTFEIRISGNTSFRNQLDDNRNELYKNFLVNYDFARHWRTEPSSIIKKMPFEKSEFWYKIKTDGAGFWKISYDDLKKLPAFCDPQSLKLYTMQKNSDGEYNIFQIPMQIIDDNHQTDETDQILFYIPPKHSLTEKYFWLTFGASFEVDGVWEEDFSNPFLPQQIISLQRKVISGSTVMRQTVDGVIIYPESGVFETQSEELAALHPELNLILKSQADIFDEYSGGSADYLAIRNYLEDTYNTYPELYYCVLMGSGTTDWNAATEKNKIIVFPATTAVYAADDNFAIFTGSSFPALAMGRLPAQNIQTMNFLINRISEYTNNPVSGFWRNKVLIMADDENKSGGYEGFGASGLNHTQLAQETGDLLHPAIVVEKVMGFNYPFDEFQNKPDARMAMIKSINEGRLIWYYIGHGNNDVLGDEEYFRGSQHLGLLENIEYLPLFIAASCHVGEFHQKSYDCLAEKLLFLEDGGSIASIAATSSCSGLGNTLLIKKYLEFSLNDLPRRTMGEALLLAKLFYPVHYGNSRQYHILGDPLMTISVPAPLGTVSGVPAQIQSRQLVQTEGSLGEGNDQTGIATLRVFEPQRELVYVNYDYTILDTIPYTVNYTQQGNIIFLGNNQVDNGEFSAEFFVPDDVRNGNDGLIFNYFFDEISNIEIGSVLTDVQFSNIPLSIYDTNGPQIDLFLESRSFMTGDFVSTDPLLIADIEDENGINMTGSPGHRMLIQLDYQNEPIDVTSGFAYNLGSATSGVLQWQIHTLDEGMHNLTLIVFDNFNNPTVKEVSFRSRKSGQVAIEQMLPYPNPLKKDGYFTFVITEEADITISIFSITGRKIRTLKQNSCQAGYNQIYWDGRDGEGDRIANNTYFYKIKAKQISNNKVTEKTGKVVILK